MLWKEFEIERKKTTKHKIIFFSDGDIRLARVNFVQIYNWACIVIQPAITYSKLTIETLEQGVKYVQS